MRLYFALLAATVVERLLEVVTSYSNARWSFARGGRELGREHFPAMVVLHSAFLLGCAAEPWLAGRTELASWAPLAVAAVLGCHAVRWWCIATLGRHWNTRVIVVPGMVPSEAGPYRWLAHPNYAAVVVEGIALPAIAGAWITAAGFTVLNALLLRRRIAVEDAALADLFAGDANGSTRGA
ncbi:MAG: hypothetical protein HY899_17390 [Deltaproteobacteria bacterium]|nr:hypothetical protein [Deltaproteobacteria bacterium]